MNTAKIPAVHLLNSLRQVLIEQGTFTEESDFDSSAKLLFKMADISRSLGHNKFSEPLSEGEVIKNEYVESTI